jgi:hypothetical protein
VGGQTDVQTAILPEKAPMVPTGLEGGGAEPLSGTIPPLPHTSS